MRDNLEYGVCAARLLTVPGHSLSGSEIMMAGRSGTPVARRWCTLLALGALGAALSARAHAVISSGVSGYDGLNLNTYVGADRWYLEGYTGAGTVVANIEGGVPWSGHVTLAHVSTFFKGPGAPDAPLAWFPVGTPNYDRHATMVGHVIAGRSDPANPNAPLQQGIAHGAELWGGAVATTMTGTSFTTTFNSVVDTYQIALLDGLGGRTADVLNSSWGRSGTQTGQSERVRALDALLYQTGKVLVFAAGNSGPGTGTVGDPAIMKNDITVGALGNQFGVPPYGGIASFSSRGPQGFSLPSSPTVASTVGGVRAPVDLCAPGEDITLARYAGASGGNTNAPVNDLTPNGYATYNNGTSFAAPIVAGAAALLVDAAQELGHARGVDGRVVRATLMNSADKPAGWTNNSVTIGPTRTTTQGVDYTFGAGMLNLDRAFDQALSGTTDLPGLGGGTIDQMGWDFGQVSQANTTDYVFAAPLEAGTQFAATLSWFAQDTYDTQTRLESSALWGNQDNLDLQLFRVVDGFGPLLVGQSSSIYNLNEHLFFTIPATDEYFIRVKFTGVLYDFLGGPAEEVFGLAWRATFVPAPGAAALLALVGLQATRRRRA